MNFLPLQTRTASGAPNDCDSPWRPSRTLRPSRRSLPPSRALPTSHPTSARPLQTTNRGPVGAVATGTRPEDLLSIEAAVKDQGGVSSLPVGKAGHLARAGCSGPPPPPAAPRPAWALEASARLLVPATVAVVALPTAPPTP